MREPPVFLLDTASGFAFGQIRQNPFFGREVISVIGKQTASHGAVEYEPARAGRYRPRIEAHQLRELWLLKRKTGEPITKLVEEALDIYLTYMKGIMRG